MLRDADKQYKSYRYDTCRAELTESFTNWRVIERRSDDINN